jgi:RimJ/RimL family protein N-acetyltransferase
MVQWSGPWNFTFPPDEDQLARFFLAEKTPDGLRRMQFKAVDVDSQAMVGQIGFSRIWDKTQAAHLGPVIVAPGARRQGIGREMFRQLLKVGFEELPVHRIELVVFTFNKAAISVYQQAGFQTEGVMRDIVRVGDEFWHWQMMSILQTEWKP